MFQKLSWRRRSLLVMFIMFTSQATGVNGIVNYLLPIIAGLGFEGVKPLLIYGVYAIVGTSFVFVSCFTVDHYGRRRMFLIGFTALAVILLAEGLLQWKYMGTPNKAGNIGCLVFIHLFIVLYQLIDGPSFIWVSEILPTTIRAKGIGLSMFAYFVGFITFSAPGPTAFRNIKWGTYLVFMGLSLICWVMVYLWIPETKGLPIEEIGELFGDTVVVYLTKDRLGIVEEKEMGESIATEVVLVAEVGKSKV